MTSIMDKIHKVKDVIERGKKLITLRGSVKIQLTNMKKWNDSVLNQKDFKHTNTVNLIQG